jgi:hypothetical protein
MEADCEVNILCLVKEHFSKATDGDGKLVWEDVKGYGYEDARRAIIEHRREKGSQAWRPDLGRVKALASTYFRDRRRDRWNNCRVVDYHRQNDKTGILHELPDLEAVEAHFTNCWADVEQRTEGFGRDIARAYILNGARMAFRELGLVEAEVERRSRECVNLKPTEKIPRKALFQPMPSEPKDSFEALKALAVAELVQQNVAVAS